MAAAFASTPTIHGAMRGAALLLATMLLVAPSLPLAVAASASLATNADFEDPDASGGAQFTAAGWTLTGIAGTYLPGPTQYVC